MAYIVKKVKAVSISLNDDNTELSIKFNVTVGLDLTSDPKSLYSYEDTEMPVVTSSNPTEGWGSLLSRGETSATSYVNTKYNS